MKLIQLDPIIVCFTFVLVCADLYVVDLQHGEELVEAGTQHGDGRGLDHQAAAWRRASSMESPQ